MKPPLAGGLVGEDLPPLWGGVRGIHLLSESEAPCLGGFPGGWRSCWEPRGCLSPLGGGASLPSPGGAPRDPPGAHRARSCCTSSGRRRSSAGSCGKGCSCSCRARRAAGDEGLTARAVPTALSSSLASRPRCSLPSPHLTPRPTVFL